MRDLVIQIVNYKTKKYLLDCLATVFRDLQDTKLSYLVTVLDNNSGDDLSDLGKLYPHKLACYKSDKNLGFGGGHNLLAKKVQAKYLLILNPDIKIIEPRTIESLVARANKYKAQIFGPRLVTNKGLSQWWDHGELHGLLAWIALNNGLSYWKEQSRPIEVAWVSGAVFLMEKELFHELGEFDENFFLYDEELDLCWRAREGGAKIFYDPTISVLHRGGVVARREDHLPASRNYYIKKHLKNKPTYPIARALNFLLHRQTIKLWMKIKKENIAS